MTTIRLRPLAPRVTVRTSCLVPQMYRRAEVCNVALAVARHAPNDRLRDELVPINRRHPIAELLAACWHYLDRQNGRSVTFEYTMLDGVNDQPEHARELARLLRGQDAKVNLIPFNTFPGTKYRRSPAEVIRRFRDLLVQGGVMATVRRTRGDDIDAACGIARAGARRTQETRTDGALAVRDEGPVSRLRAALPCRVDGSRAVDRPRRIRSSRPARSCAARDRVHETRQLRWEEKIKGARTDPRDRRALARGRVERLQDISARRAFPPGIAPDADSPRRSNSLGALRSATRTRERGEVLKAATSGIPYARGSDTNARLWHGAPEHGNAPRSTAPGARRKSCIRRRSAAAGSCLTRQRPAGLAFIERFLATAPRPPTLLSAIRSRGAQGPGGCGQSSVIAAQGVPGFRSNARLDDLERESGMSPRGSGLPGHTPRIARKAEGSRRGGANGCG